ncbi:ABC transporter permease [Nocardioides sp. YIM 152315]|uniref:ABC transporter permease n=1 Tax=Nocardioides sp. YIM 152315 TaxID=3031760 RepID=UPI0023DCDD07|nr:ABC transporter permease [Nocardioides sp. YIM 152315]MDF1604332.1 FtsX-like permease family protein [Nocardioides sp. YIM 152315]
MSALASWRLALRLARRDAMRHRGRSVLVLVMIALPVLAVTAADVVIATQEVSGVESLDRRLGAADALVEVPAGGAPMLQAFDPYDGSTSADGVPADHEPPAAAEVSDVLGGVRLLERRQGDVYLRTDDGVAYVWATEVDLRDPLTRGLFDLGSGRWPADSSEVVVNREVRDQGYAVGDRLDLVGDDAPAPIVVGIAESTTSRTMPVVAGPIGSLGIEPSEWSGPAWLAAGGDVSWAEVEELNALGATALSRAVLADPPPDSEAPEEIRAWSSGTDDAMVAAIVLIVVMALLEVVLLAGPAFAVTARRQARTLALMASAGGTPAQSRRAIIGGGVVLGTVAALLGVALGIGAGRLLVPVVQHWSGEWFGPFDVPWLHLLGIALFGLVSAVLASVVPAWIASRQDVVAVLSGRRADTRPSLRSPILGVVLIGVGVAGSAYGATSGSSGEFAIAASAVVAVLGMILLVPVVVAGVARLAGRLPLSPRYAARDAARHRTRTVPAVAAVAATVAGVVALGIAVTSDEAENEGTYQAMLPMGDGAVTAYDLTPPQWRDLHGAVAAKVPDADVVLVDGLVESTSMAEPDARSYYLETRAPGVPRHQPLLSMMATTFGSSVLVDDDMPEIVRGVSDAGRRRGDAALAEGRVVVFTDRPVDADRVVLRPSWSTMDDSGNLPRATVPATYVPIDRSEASASLVIPPAVIDRLDLPHAPVALAVSGGRITPEQEEAVTEAVQAVTNDGGFYVERGYQADDETVIVQLVLAGLGGVLMLGGTLTATFLALSDARPDLATLSAVGASPRRRRWIAASYALVIGVVGAVLGAAVGFIPGIAVTYPLTRGWDPEVEAHYLDVPWLMILGVVVALPLVTAALVALFARSRLPLVARVD